MTATPCRHCGQPVQAGAEFCCPGCEAAWGIVHDLGLDQYYARRSIDTQARPLRPDEEAAPDVAAHVRTGADGTARLNLMVDGLQCAACVWLIETALNRQPGVRAARLNMTTRRLSLDFDPTEADANMLVASVARLGYRLVPFDPDRLGAADARNERELLRALAVSGFAAANIMLLSVAVWAGHVQGMGEATRDLMHWVSALIALPTVAYAGRPFFRSALGALRAGRTNMDVPISLGVLLVTGMSLFETAQGGLHAYFDGAVMLLFFLLIGRYLDRRARGRARSAAEQLVALSATSVCVVEPDGATAQVPPDRVAPGMTVLVAAGERIPVDGMVTDGASDIDTGLISGESVPGTARTGERVFAGTLNLTAPLRLTVAAVGEGTLLGEIVRLMEAAERGRARYVAVADRVSRLYAPVVHVLAAATFAGWMLFGDAGWHAALTAAAAVLIVTCPCALALAVPVVQVVANGRLLRRGILLKSATALERLAQVDTVVFDKTGTLTEGLAELRTGGVDRDALAFAATLAGASRHPLARALVRAAPPAAVAEGVREVPGAGLALLAPEGEVRLGSRRFVGIEDGGPDDAGPELWLARPGRPPVRFAFDDAPRPDADEVVARLSNAGLRVELLSGDRRGAVDDVARRLGIADVRAEQAPAAKAARLEELARSGARVLMVGDGLNDAPALAAASVSMSPATAADVSQTAADLVFQGRRLAPVLEAVAVARRAERIVRQNFALALLYNLFTVPLAVTGYVTPLIAAVAMSTSSIVVIANALRLAVRETRNDRPALPDPDRARPGPGRPVRLPVGAEVRPV